MSGATLPQAVGIGLMRMAFTLSAPFGHLGISRVNRLVGRTLMGDRETIYALNPSTSFRAPAGDYYWSLLYNNSFEYEPELARLLNLFRDLDYQFLDLGANYGYWSILASSPEFGSKRVIAVEASAASFDILAVNAAQRDGSVIAHHGAIWNVSGQMLEFFGTRHAGRSLVKNKSAEQEKESVTTMTVADLVALYPDGPERLILKLDVEGVEMAAVEGAAGVMDRIDAIIFEESNNALYGKTFLKLRETTGFEIFFFDEKKGFFGAVDSPFDIFVPREGKRPLQSHGFNFVAVRPESSCAQKFANKQATA